jgi:nucleoside-diphosphate-sugar epimerase
MILLTGATGFLGSQLLIDLLDKNYEVVALKRSFSNTMRISGVLGDKKLHLLDIDLLDNVEIFRMYSIDTIIHTATEYGRNETPMYKLVEANLLLPLRLAELGISKGVKTFINTDTYFNKAKSSYSNLLNYSLSKKSLLFCLAKLSDKLKVINVILEHIYGPYDSETKFVENMIQNIAVERVPRVSLTKGCQKRDFIYIEDVVSAYLTLVEYGRTHNFLLETFELGTGQCTQIKDFCETIKLLSNSPTILAFGDIPYRTDEIIESRADISKLKRLGWSPTFTFSDGLEGILNKYDGNFND